MVRGKDEAERDGQREEGKVKAELERKVEMKVL